MSICVDLSACKRANGNGFDKTIFIIECVENLIKTLKKLHTEYYLIRYSSVNIDYQNFTVLRRKYRSFLLYTIVM